MAEYEKQTWEDYDEETKKGTRIDANRMDHIEQGIYDATEESNSNSDAIDELNEGLTKLNDTVDTKADSSDVEENKNAIDGLNEGLTKLNDTVDTKADSSDVEENKNAIDGLNENLSRLNEDLTKLDILNESGSTIPSGADLNDYTTPGKYCCTGASIATNIVNTPTTAAGYALIVFKAQNSAERIMQFVFDAYNFKVYFRSYCNSSNAPRWYDWGTVADATQINTSLSELQDNVGTNKTNIEQNANSITQLNEDLSNNTYGFLKNAMLKCADRGYEDWNDVKTVGFYSGNGLTNAPRSGWIAMIVMRADNNSNYPMQLAFSIVNILYIRICNNGTWTDWQTIDPSTINTSLTNLTNTVEEIDNSNAIKNLGTEILSDEDLNNYTTPGKYFVSDENASNIVNAPLTSYGYTLLVIVTQEVDRLMQIVLRTSADNIVYIRSCVDNEWTSWEQMAKKTYLKYSIYNSLSNIGLTDDTATSLLAITQAMGSNSILFISVNSSDTSTLYSNGVIPVSSAGTLEIIDESRSRAIYVRDNGNMYVCATSNGSSSAFSDWKRLLTEDDIYYQSGDSISMTNLNTAGYVTSSSESVRFVVPLSKQIASGVSVSVSGVTLTLRQNNSYTHGSSSDSGVSPSSCSVSKLGSGALYINATMSKTTNVTNNDAIGVQVNAMTIKFS